MNNSDEDEYFPWLIKFTPLLNAVIENTNDDVLGHLLTVYEKNISKDSSTCSHKQLKLVMLKNHIKNTLNFFHFYWRNYKEVTDRYSYLNKMTAILKVYLDLAVQIDKQVDSANILTALCLYLDNSKEHIFKILLKGRYETEELKKLYCPIFAKFLTNFESTKESMKDFTYVRYLLAFKLWEKIVDNSDERLKIKDMVQQKLGSLVPQMDLELSKIIPKPPNGHMNATWWLMKYSLVNLQKICDDFLELEEKINSFSVGEKLENSQFELEKPLEEKVAPVKKKMKRTVPKLKKNQLLLIDLTSDNDEVEKIITKKQKPIKRPQWWNEIKIQKTNLKNKCKKPQTITKRIKSVEVVDANSIENCDSVENYCENMHQKCDVTVNNSNEINSDLLNTSKILINDSYNEKSSDSHHDVVDSSTTSVKSSCDYLNSSVLIFEPMNTFDYVNDDISSQTDIKLLSSWDNVFEKNDHNDVWRSTTFEDYLSESSSGIGTDSYKTFQEEIFDEQIIGKPSNLINETQSFHKRNHLIRGILNCSPSEFFYSEDQRINPNLLLKKPEEMDDNTEFMEDKEDSSDEKDVDEQMQNEVSSTSSIHYRKSRIRNYLEEVKSNISFDLEDLCESEKLVHDLLPFKKRYLKGGVHENGLSLFNKADL